MNNIEQCTTIDALRQFSMQDLCSLYSKLTKTHAPKFSDKGAAAKRILPMLEQKRSEAKLTVVPAPQFTVHPTADGGAVVKVKRGRGRPAGQTLNRTYVFDFAMYQSTNRRLAPQAKQILDALAAIGKTRYVETELQQTVKVKTKQDPWRIFQYYRPKMIACRVLKMENGHAA